jgi:hypothetical protein
MRDDEAYWGNAVAPVDADLADEEFFLGHVDHMGLPLVDPQEEHTRLQHQPSSASSGVNLYMNNDFSSTHTSGA